MLNRQILNPESIVVIGASDDTKKPGGKALQNIIESFKGKIYVGNPKADFVQGIKSYKNLEELPQTDLAILAIPAQFCLETVKILAFQKQTRAFIIFSAGFGETSPEGAIIEHGIVDIVNSVSGVLIGPNCIGVLTPNYSGVFTSPIPKLNKNGVDFISGSGATAVFIMESGIPKGLQFSNVFSVGNSVQTCVEDILEYMDENFSYENDSHIKLLYLEQISNPQKLLKHSRSLIKKGCKIAAVKAGSSSAGSRAASSHTGALANSDMAVDNLFKKAGIVRCYGREDLVAVACVLMQKSPKGKNFAIITHAGGPAVMLTDALEKHGMKVPEITQENKSELLEKLYPGSSVSNPIDFLATGTAEQLSEIIDFVENKVPGIDSIAIIFGSPGLSDVYEAYRLIDKKTKTCKKPIYPVLPSLKQAKLEIDEFLSSGNVFFPDEVILANAVSRVLNTSKPTEENPEMPEVNVNEIRKIIDESENGYLNPEKIQQLLDFAGITRAKEFVAESMEQARLYAEIVGYPLVMKVVGPIHKSDVGGVVLNVKTEEQLTSEYTRMMQIKDTTGILLQAFLTGTELFAGVNYEEKFGHQILAGLGGIYIEVLKDVSSCLSPVSKAEAELMIKSLKSYKLIEGVRGQKGINFDKFVNIIQRISALVSIAPEIIEMDLNPLLGTFENIVAVDARINIKKKKNSDL